MSNPHDGGQGALRNPIFVVGRTSGEYSDRSEDLVCYFSNQTDAQNHALHCQRTSQDAAQRWEAFKKSKDYEYDIEDVTQFIEGLPDPTFRPANYASEDVTYWVWKIGEGEASRESHPPALGQKEKGR